MSENPFEGWTALPYDSHVGYYAGCMYVYPDGIQTYLSSSKPLAILVPPVSEMPTLEEFEEALRYIQYPKNAEGSRAYSVLVRHLNYLRKDRYKKASLTNNS